MQSDITKACADYLRDMYDQNPKLKSSHAHELVAAYFGYSSRAALLADSKFPIENLGKATLFIPDIELLASRMKELEGLPEAVSNVEKLAEVLTKYIEDQDYFTADVWLTPSLEDYLLEDYLSDNQVEVDDRMIMLISSEGGHYYTDPIYDTFSCKFEGDYFIAAFTGGLIEEPHPARVFTGSELTVSIEIKFRRVAGRTAFHYPEISVKSLSPDNMAA